MKFSFAQLLEEILISIKKPKIGAARVLAWQLPDAAVWPFFSLSIVLSTLMAEVNSYLNPPDPGLPQVYIAPGMLAAMFFVVNGTMAFALGSVGRGFGGVGSVRSALILVSWQQYIGLFGMLVLAVLGLVLPGVSGGMSMALVLILFWIMLCFTAVLHGFSSLWIAAAVLALSTVIAGIAMAMMFGLFAISLGGVTQI